MLYFDESGYTGPDLTNSNQPYFSLASIRMTNEEIAQIKKMLVKLLDQLIQKKYVERGEKDGSWRVFVTQ